MPSRFDPPQDPEQPPSSKVIDKSKRYDVYCRSWFNRLIVFRNVLFKRVARLHVGHFHDWIELEQADGQVVFISVNSIEMFCETGGNPSFEKADS